MRRRPQDSLLQRFVRGAVAALVLWPVPGPGESTADLDPLATIERAFLAEAYDEVVLLSTDVLESTARADPDLHFLHGMALYELGRGDEARAQLRRHIDEEGAFSREARQVLALLDVKPDQAAARVTLLTQAGMIHDSHILVADPASETFFREEDDFALRLRLALDWDHASGWLFRYRGYWLGYQDVSDHDRLEQEIQGGRSLDAWGGEWTLAAVAESRLRDYDADFWRTGGRSEIAWLVRDHRVFWTGLDVGWDQFPEFSDADGFFVLGSAGYEQYFNTASLFWDAYVQWHDADTDAQAFVEGGAGLVGSWLIRRGLVAGVGLRGAHVQFGAFDPFLGMERDDTFYSARLWFTVALHDGWHLVPSFEYVNSDSNASFADYDEHIAGVDLMRSW